MIKSNPPTEKQIYDNDDEIYKIILEDGSDLVVSKEHKVYVSINQNLSSISLGDKTFDGINFLSTLSPEKIGQSNLRESATYCTSLECPESSSSAFSKNSEKSDSDMKVICFNTNISVLSKISFDNPDLLNICSLCFPNSVNRNSGAINSNFANKLFSANILNEFPLLNNEESRTLTSTTTSILNQERYLFDRDSLILSENSFTSSSVNFDLESPLCSSIISSNLDLINLPMSIDQSMLDCLMKLNSSGILIQTSAMSEDNLESYKNLSVDDFKLQKITETYEEINNGKEIYFLNSENKPVRVKSITKQAYNGKIYDVDVENDVVLVGRNSASEIWGGNNNQ